MQKGILRSCALFALVVLCVQRPLSSAEISLAVKFHALRQRPLQHSNIQKHSRLPAVLRLFDKEIVKRHRFHVRALMMPFCIERLALGYSVQKKFFVFLFDFHLAHT
jgi:hypothetical protein